MELQHHTRNIRITARKLRLVTEKVKYMPTDKAIALLPLVNHGGAVHVEKALKAAVGAARDKNYDTATLIVQRISVDEGTAMKRVIGHSRGRMAGIMKKYSHINIVLTGEQLGAKKATPAKAAKTEKTEEPAVTAEEK